MKKSSRRAVQVGAGVTAAILAAAAGAYLLSGKKGQKRRAAMKAWMVKARGEVAKQAKMAKRLSQAEYKNLVDRAVKKYGRIEDMSAADMMRAARDLKAEWENVKKHARMMVGETTTRMQPAKRRKPAARRRTGARK